MNIFKIGNLLQWDSVSAGDVIQFEATGARRVKLEVNCNAEYEVWVAPTDDMEGATLLAFTSGLAFIEYVTKGDSYVQFRAPKDVSVFVRGFAHDQRVAPSQEVVYTSITPRQSVNPDMARMMQLMKLNELARDQQQARQLAALRAELTPKPETVEVIEPVVEPVVEPVAEVVADAAK